MKNGHILSCTREHLPENIIVNATMSVYISADILKDYLSLIRWRYKRIYIIQDSCTTHVKEEIKEMYESHNMTVSTILGRFTKYLQPLDAIAINSIKKQT